MTQLLFLFQPCTKSLRELVLSHNRCGDSGLFMLKLGLLANRSIEKLVLSNTRMTCEGLWLCLLSVPTDFHFLSSW